MHNDFIFPELPDVKKKIQDTIYNADVSFKALTGRTPEIIYDQTGLDVDTLFPETGNILYVGDPWQRMGKTLDRDNLYIIDYEFGETASFVTDKECFFEKLFNTVLL